MPEVTQEDREAAWPFRPSCYRDIPLTRVKWEAGVYDDAAPCIKAFARHREASVAAKEAEIAALQAKCDALARALGKIGTTYKGNNARLIHSETQIRDIARAALAKHKGDA